MKAAAATHRTFFLSQIFYSAKHGGQSDLSQELVQSFVCRHGSYVHVTLRNLIRSLNDRELF